MGRPRTAKHPKHAEPEDEIQESPEEEAAVVIEPEPAGDAPNKSEAARQAIDAGYDKPANALPWIKETFGIEIGGQHFSAIKSQYLKKQAAAPKTEPAKRGRKPKAAAAVANGYVAPPEKPMAAGEPDLLLALEGVKELVSQFGADRVKRMVDIIG
jgi:hypothetical protein